MPKRILIITGPGGDAQGWGNMHVTRCMCDALNSGGASAEIAFVETGGAFLKALANKPYDIVWSALYCISPREDIVGLNGSGDLWVADVLDAKAIPYIGPGALAMKRLIHKYETHRRMHARGVPAPWHYLANAGDALPDVSYPAFVKPSCESRSAGIGDESVVHSPAELARRARYIWETFKQAALVEEYLPGMEYTVLMLGNGLRREFLPGLVTVDASHYGKYRILRSDLRGVGLTKLSVPATQADEARALARQAADALQCFDHVRVDMRADANGRFKVIEINGIPGLKPVKSWSPQLYSLYHPSPEGHAEEYRQMLHRIVASGLDRYGLNS